MYVHTYHLKVATGGILVQIIFFYFHKFQVLKGKTTIHDQVQEVQSSVFLQFGKYRFDSALF